MFEQLIEMGVKLQFHRRNIGWIIFILPYLVTLISSSRPFIWIWLGSRHMVKHINRAKYKAAVISL